MRISTLLSSLLAVSLFASTGLAQPITADEARAIVTTAAPIFIYPDAARTPLRTAAVNTTLKLVEEQGEWLRVEFQDPQFGRRVGWVQAKNVRVVRPEQTPMDLSIRPDPPPASAAAAAPPPVSQQAPRDHFERGWIDVNFGAAFPRDPDPSFADVVTVSLEDATFAVQYHWKTGAAFNVGGGVMFTRQFGLGVSFQGHGHTGPADLAIRIPHPLTFNRYATDSGATKEDQGRAESALNIHAMLVADVSRDLRVRFFGGPTGFRLQQDVVDNITYDQTYTTAILGYLNAVDITGYDTSKIEFSDGYGWGFNVGGDVTWFFTRVVGIGGFASYNSGTITTFDPLTLEDGKFKMGGTQAGGGLRLRF